MESFKKMQQGISFSGFIMTAFLFILIAVLGMKVVPPYIQSAQISSIFKALASESAMQSASIAEIKQSFNKRASLNRITEVTAEDIEIGKDGSTLILNANYVVKIPLVGNVTLLLEFNPSSS
ncbi:MAG: DUF4845 domain-containing protein [Sideroxydans sp.]|nr:DUF4845 domain-containing protein [Sideroxydans sp.]